MTFHDLPAGWTWARLDQLLAEPLSNGRSVRSRDGGFPVLRLTALRHGDVDLTARKAGDWTAGEAAPWLVEDGDFLVARGNGSLSLVGRGGLVGAVKSPVAFPDTMIRVRLDTAVLDSRYLRTIWHSRCIRLQVEAGAKTTAGIYKVSQATLNAIQVPLAPLNEQRRIASTAEALLTQIDVAIAGTARLSERLARLVDASLGDLVRQASATSADAVVGTVCDVVGGVQKQPKRHPTPEQPGIPFLRVANVGRRTLDLADVHRIVVAPAELERVLLQAGDLLVVEGNGSPEQIGRAALWNGALEPCTHQNHLIRVRPGQDVLPEYLAFFWNAPSTAEQLRKVASTTSGLYTLNKAKVGGVQIPVPPLDAQRRLVDEAQARLELAERTRGDVLRLAQRLRSSAQAVLVAAARGALVPQTGSDEPADLTLKAAAGARQARAAGTSRALPKPRTGRAPKTEETSE